MKHALLPLLILVWSANASAAPLSGVDCDCTETGAYVLPIAPVDVPTANGITGATPLGKYLVSAMSQGDGSALVSIATAAAPTTTILSVPGVSWGFSPDDDRFVIVHWEGGLPYARLYNLAGVNPATWIYQTQNLNIGGYLSFSPNGRYAIAMWLGPNNNIFNLSVRDAVTGAEVHHNQFAFAAPPADALPSGETQLTSVVVGFGPDADDRSLVYAYAQVAGGTTQNHWSLVNLLGNHRTGWHTPSNYGFEWGFSPCGDVLSVVVANSFTSLKEARLHSTLDFAQLADVVEYPIIDYDVFTASAASHVVTHYMTPVTIAANVADNACAGSTTVPPTAVFSAPATALTLTSVAFNDQSTSSPAAITSYRWDFGDGGVAYVADPTHMYFSPGTYSVELTVTNSQGRADTVSHDIEIEANQAPVASFTYTPLNPVARDIVTFTNTSTNDDGPVTAYWSIGNASFTGDVVQAKVCSPSVSVTLVARDEAGLEGMVTEEIAVTSSPEVVVPAGGDLVAAAAAACPGDTLILEAGHYTGGVTLNGVNLRGAGAGVTWIDGYGDATSSGGWVLTLQSPWISWDEDPRTVTVSDVTVTGGGTSATEGGGILLQSEGPSVLSDVEVTDNAGLAGIWSYNFRGSIDIHDASVHHNGGSGIWLDNSSDVSVQRTDVAFNLAGGALITESTGILFAHNDVHDNSNTQRWAGLMFDLGGSSSIVSNRVYGNTSSSSEGVAVYLSGSMLFAGNLVVANQVGGIYDEDAATITGNTIANNCGTGLGLRYESTSLSNSILYNNALDLDGTLGVDESNLVGVNPMFVGARDYHLASRSPAIDDGNNAFVPVELTTDGDGDARTVGTSVDIGWDEWSTGQASGAVSAIGCDYETLDGGVDASVDEDAGEIADASTPDASLADASLADASLADASVIVDAGNQPGTDSGVDAGSGSDAGTPPRNEDNGCACSLASTQRSPLAPFAFLSVLALLTARRRLIARCRVKR